MMAYCICEREQGSESYTDSSAGKSVAVGWDPKRERVVLSSDRLHQRRLKAPLKFVCLLRSPLLSAEYAIWFHSSANYIWMCFP